MDACCKFFVMYCFMFKFGFHLKRLVDGMFKLINTQQINVQTIKFNWQWTETEKSKLDIYCLAWKPYLVYGLLYKIHGFSFYSNRIFLRKQDLQDGLKLLGSSNPDQVDKFHLLLYLPSLLSIMFTVISLVSISIWIAEE